MLENRMSIKSFFNALVDRYSNNRFSRHRRQ